ncbi:hypothetical protein MIND_00931900 [Mycena indigotica]|uniref:Ser-Thr-rich glycosyl-phosphatidyl-inositol-anchored membrane family-domain-containing protein n=1 Tax=Mycena indigotica TaxID=2126181 RepID=A0A8H6SDZ9_9AGAR|nr:uncharacterized protein MIND_00931900 [Mycena indigotica]KAF7296996.1 hypothetical protein MIND_00931900 [Mycena indigotica]
MMALHLSLSLRLACLSTFFLVVAGISNVRFPQVSQVEPGHRIVISWDIESIHDVNTIDVVLVKSGWNQLVTDSPKHDAVVLSGAVDVQAKAVSFILPDADEGTYLLTISESQSPDTHQKRSILSSSTPFIIAPRRIHFTPTGPGASVGTQTIAPSSRSLSALSSSISVVLSTLSTGDTAGLSSLSSAASSALSAIESDASRVSSAESVSATSTQTHDPSAASREVVANRFAVACGLVVAGGLVLGVGLL